jgi:hypothetical protein
MSKFEDSLRKQGARRVDRYGDLVAAYFESPSEKKEREALEARLAAIEMKSSKTKVPQGVGSRLKWKKDLNLIPYLFERLESLKIIEAPNLDPWAILSSIFLDKDNEPVTRDKLKQLFYNYKGNKSGRPRNHAVIDEAISGLPKQ